MSKPANGGWKSSFCNCLSEPGPCLLIGICQWPGLAIVQCLSLKRASSQTPSPTVGLLLTCCCWCFGAAYNRQSIRELKKLPKENYFYDCGAYALWCLCCMGVQEFAQVK